MREERFATVGLALLLVLLAGGSLFGSWRRTVLSPYDDLSGRLLFGERLMLAGKFCEPAPTLLKTALLQWAVGREWDPVRLALLQDRPVSELATRSLSPGYRLLAQYQRTPTPALAEQLSGMGSRALLRLNQCLIVAAGLFLIALASLLLAERGPARWPQSAPALALVLGVYWAWDCWNLFAVGPVTTALAPTLSGVPRLLLVSVLGYAAMALLLLAAGRHTGWRPPLGWSAGWVGPGFLACLVGVGCADLISSWLTGAPAPLSGLSAFLLFRSSAGDVLTLGVFACLVAPFFEELMFRGWLLAGLVPRIGEPRAILLSAVAFALVHGEMSYFLGLSTLGVVLGWVYLRSGSLWAPVIVHAMWNLWGMVEIYANRA